jgi:DNA-directed RNA polymerase subunit beta
MIIKNIKVINKEKLLLSYTEKKRLRVNFGNHVERLGIPYLNDIQIRSYSEFIQLLSDPEKRKNIGLENVFRSIFPIYSKNKNVKLEYVLYNIGRPLFTSDECKIKGLTYASPLKVKVNLKINCKNETDMKSIVQEIYMLEMPLMTEKGTFVINGTERVIVSQLHRSPGVFFEIDKSKYGNMNKFSYIAKIIPYRGSWLEIEIDAKNCLFAKVDKKKKFPVTILLKGLNLDKERILFEFLEKYSTNLNDNIVNKVLADDILYDNQILICKNSVLDLDKINFLKLKNIKNITLFSDKYISYINNTLKLDNISDQFGAFSELYKIFRPGEIPTKDSAKKVFENLFFSNDRYDLSEIGRTKINSRIKNHGETKTILSKNDIIYTIKKLIDVKEGHDFIDDIDNLGNRRVRSVGEIIENQLKIGFFKMEKSIREKLSISEYENLTPHDIINARPLSSMIREFFCSSQLSQFMDQTNPLSEITHKRRLSALGPGGLTRERAGFEVRDVHNTHYGRICPIETPEGPNIGLINSLAVYARINEHGFIETPYIKLRNKKITDEIEYLSAIEESEFAIAQANVNLNKETMELKEEIVSCRLKNEFILSQSDKIQYMDISPKQIVSIATALIPFLEHDDANRALMGSNMQRQAVPLLISKTPLVGTGVEKIVAVDSGSTVIADESGIVDKVDANKIVIKINQEDHKNKFKLYKLIKYSRSNQNTLINQKPIVKIGDAIEKGDIIADGSCTDLGELALGQNFFIAFMSWNGYNFEDSIVISESVVKNNKLCSIHIEEFICVARDLKLGPEEITSDIPYVNDTSLIKKLDESGVIKIGEKVKPGDILVGKVTKKNEVQLSPEEKLVQAIFGEKSTDLDDSSLRTPNGIYGTVIDVQVFSRSSVKKDKRTVDLEDLKIKNIKENLDNELKKLKYDIITNIKYILDNNKEKLYNLTLDDIIKASKEKPEEIKISDDYLKSLILKKTLQLRSLDLEYNLKLKSLESRIRRGDDLPAGIVKMVKISIAMKRQIQVGDKLSGRHGNKGVISAIVPVEDMPFLKNGKTIEMILNPLGVPSRMNIGQVLETHLGWASKELGLYLYNLSLNLEENSNLIKDLISNIYNVKDKIKIFILENIKTISENLRDGIPFATPVFDGIKEHNIKKLLELAKLPKSGKTVLYDGRTGLEFDNKITVGYQYIMKLNHLIDDKMHARSTGAYSLISQQPLGGKAQFGGQRFGEMEVWALEAYGAAYTLLEMLTIKSDDILGRTKIYKNIIDNNYQMETGIPEAFHVLSKEILSLGLNLDLEKE